MTVRGSVVYNTASGWLSMVSRRNWPSMTLSERRTMRRPSGATSSSAFLGHDRAIVEHGELHVELRVGADAGDFRRGDAAREHQRAGGGAAAIAVQDRVRSDDVRHAVDLHQAQRAFLVEHACARSASGD